MLNVYIFILNFKHVTCMSQDKFHAESFNNINLKIIRFFVCFVLFFVLFLVFIVNIGACHLLLG